MEVGLGQPAEHLGANEQAIWKEIAPQATRALASDRPSFELLVALEAQKRSGAIDPANLHVLAELRSKFFLPPDAEA